MTSSLKRSLLPCVAAAFLLAPAVAGAENNILSNGHKIGLGLGSSSFAGGISAKYFVSNSMALQAVVGTAFGLGLDVGADVVLEMPQLWSNNIAALNWHFGAGAELGLWYGMAIGVAGHAGLGLQLKQWPLEFTADLRPTLWLGDWIGSGFHFAGGGSVRWFF